MIAAGVPTLSALTSATYIDLQGNGSIPSLDIDNLRIALPSAEVVWP